MPLLVIKSNAKPASMDFVKEISALLAELLDKPLKVSQNTFSCPLLT